MDLFVGYFIFRAVFFLHGGSLWTCLALAPNPRDWRDSVRKRWVGDTHSIIKSFASPPVPEGNRREVKRMVRRGSGEKKGECRQALSMTVIVVVQTWLDELVLTAAQIKSKETCTIHTRKKFYKIFRVCVKKKLPLCPKHKIFFI